MSTAGGTAPQHGNARLGECLPRAGKSLQQEATTKQNTPLRWAAKKLSLQKVMVPLWMPSAQEVLFLGHVAGGSCNVTQIRRNGQYARGGLDRYRRVKAGVAEDPSPSALLPSPRLSPALVPEAHPHPTSNPSRPWARAHQPV